MREGGISFLSNLFSHFFISGGGKRGLGSRNNFFPIQESEKWNDLKGAPQAESLIHDITHQRCLKTKKQVPVKKELPFLITCMFNQTAFLTGQ